MNKIRWIIGFVIVMPFVIVLYPANFIADSIEYFITGKVEDE